MIGQAIVRRRNNSKPLPRKKHGKLHASRVCLQRPFQGNGNDAVLHGNAVGLASERNLLDPDRGCRVGEIKQV